MMHSGRMARAAAKQLKDDYVYFSRKGLSVSEMQKNQRPNQLTQFGQIHVTISLNNKSQPALHAIAGRLRLTACMHWPVYYSSS